MITIYNNRKKVIFITLGLLCLLPIINPPLALILGFSAASLGIAPSANTLSPWVKNLLGSSIVGLGFGIQLNTAITASVENFPLIVGSILFTLLLGYFLTKSLKLNTKTGYLISAGTAICGGSAIAAITPAINANSHESGIALATIFILNAIALFLFPTIGHLLSMSQHEFGIWSAIAIHDTSSVIGAASAYGNEALLTATTIKLARALWIIPIAFISAMLFKGDSKRIQFPYFIALYCIAIATAHWLPEGQALYQLIFDGAKRLLVVCLFLIGAGITIEKMKQAGMKPLILGVGLWFSIGTTSLIYILNFN
ncbi:YeiH family protein [Shewanella surugensis]|uniref:Sulfate exporter family transporter n=1 Tax=Shewanella surugensis TaxID=212020 RepID=A0ABT0L9I8_9GAMM|nr:putative sulfate exporter family transporter [Shewanella surugensis]MCL1124382.1 putative sulfate exporter family transporter [Shewanella surugensis]